MRMHVACHAPSGPSRPGTFADVAVRMRLRRTPSRSDVTTRQGDLFPPQPALPEGFRYEDDFLDAREEEALCAVLTALPLQEARFKDWTAKRRVVSYGGRYDFASNTLLPAQPIPPCLRSVRERAARWVGVAADALDHALVSEYRPGTQLGWHRDVPEFSTVIGISLHGPGRMRLRPYPHLPGARQRTVAVELARRSIYSLAGGARWRWQHAISPTTSRRYSITFRTLRR
jgi:alkylated DNA repair dioxygenase AlkB